MKKTARVIVTFQCNRRCPGCCNSNLPEYRKVHTDEELMGYQEIVITGGEPMLIPGKTLEFINRMWDKGYRGKMYLYTSPRFRERASNLWMKARLLRMI